MFGCVACGLCYLSMAIAGTVKSTGKESGSAIVAFVALYTFFYNGCINAPSYTIATEVVSSRLRAWTVGSATSVGCVLSWLTLYCTPYFINPQDLNWVRYTSSLQQAGKHHRTRSSPDPLVHLLPPSTSKIAC